MALIHILLAALRCHYCTMPLCSSQSLCCWSPPDQFDWYPSAETDWICGSHSLIHVFGWHKNSCCYHTCPPKYASYPNKLVSYFWRNVNCRKPQHIWKASLFFHFGWRQKPHLQTDGHMLSAHLSPSLWPFRSLRWLIVKKIPSAAICVR